MSITVEDHIAIERLMYTYARCADDKDYAGFARVFCQDAVFVYHGQDVTPLAAIQELMRNLESFQVTQHRVQNVLYDVQGDSASGTTYCLASHLVADDTPPLKVDMAVTYRDALRRESGCWLIARREFTVLWTQTTAVDELR